MSMNRRPSPCALALAIATLLPLGSTLAQEQDATTAQAE